MHTCESCHDPIKSPAPKPNETHLCLNCYLDHEDSRKIYAASVSQENQQPQSAKTPNLPRGYYRNDF